MSLNPSDNGYKDLSPFRFWCQKVLPAVYDESLSYYELLCKVVDYLNSTMDNVKALNNTYLELKTYVDNYFENLDVSNEINHKLDEMAADGTLGDLIENRVEILLPPVVDIRLPGVVENQLPGEVGAQIGGVVTDQLPEIAAPVVSDWLDDHITEPGTSFIIDDSLTISGAGADAKAAGDRIKTNSNALFEIGAIPFIEKSGGYYVNNGDFNSNNSYHCKYAQIPVTSGEEYSYKGRSSSTVPAVIFFDGSNNVISYANYGSSGASKYTTVIIPNDCVSALFQSFNTTANPIVFELYNKNTLFFNAVKSAVPAKNGVEMMGGLPFNYSDIPGHYRADGTYFSSSNYRSVYVDLPVSVGDVFYMRARGTYDAPNVFYYAGDTLDSTAVASSTTFRRIEIYEGITRCLFTSWYNVNTGKLNFELYKDKTMLTEMYQRTKSSATMNTHNQVFAATTLNNNLPVGTLDRGVLCIGFDDYNTDCLRGVQYLVASGLPCYLSLIPENVTDNWNMAYWCYNRGGGEICAHSVDVLTSTNQTFNMMNEKFIEIPKIIGENGFPVYGIIRAGGTGQGTEDKNLDEYFCRLAGLKYSDYYGVNDQYTLGRHNMTTDDATSWEAYCDDLANNKKYGIVFCHHLDGSENGFTYSKFQEFVMIARNKDIDIITPNQFVDRYIYNIPSTSNLSRLVD